MTINDPIADMLARIKNAQMRNKKYVSCYKSKILMNILEVMKQEGFIKDYKKSEIAKNIEEIKITLKYYESKPVIQEIRRLSKPGRRVYANMKVIPRFYNGLGVTIMSTSKGVMSAASAVEAKTGGEVICEIF